MGSSLVISTFNYIANHMNDLQFQNTLVQIKDTTFYFDIYSVVSVTEFVKVV